MILRPCFVSPLPRRHSPAITTVIDTTGTSRSTHCDVSAHPAEAQSSPSLRGHGRTAARRSAATACMATDQRHRRARDLSTASATHQRRPLSRSILNPSAESLSNGEFARLHEIYKINRHFSPPQSAPHFTLMRVFLLCRHLQHRCVRRRLVFTVGFKRLSTP